MTLTIIPTVRRPPLSLLVFIVYFLVALIPTYNVWRDPFQLALGTADSDHVRWYLVWIAHSWGHHNPFFTTALNYPFGANSTWETSIPVLGAILTPVTLTAGPIFAYTFAVVMGMTTSAMAAYLALKEIVGGRLGPFVGGILYGFSPYIIPHAPEHVNLIYVFGPPLIFLFCYRLACEKDSPWRWALLLGLTIAIQLGISAELVATSALMGVFGLFWIRYAKVGLQGRSPGRFIKGVVLAGAITGLLTSPLLYYQFFGAGRFIGSVQAPNYWVNDVFSFVTPTPAFLIYYFETQTLQLFVHKFTGSTEEWTGFVGLPLILLAGWIAYRMWNDKLVRWAALMIVTAALLSMGPILHWQGQMVAFPMPWLAFQFLPVLINVLPARLMVFVFLLLALLVAKYISLAKNAIPITLCMISLVFLVPSWPWPAQSQYIPEYFTSGAKSLPKEGSVLVLPYSTSPATFKSDSAKQESTWAMRWQAASGMSFSMPEGYVIVPGKNHLPHWGSPDSPLQDEVLYIEEGNQSQPLSSSMRSIFLEDIKAHDIRVIVLGPMAQRVEMRGFLVDLLGEPATAQGVEMWEISAK